MRNGETRRGKGGSAPRARERTCPANPVASTSCFPIYRAAPCRTQKAVGLVRPPDDAYAPPPPPWRRAEPPHIVDLLALTEFHDAYGGINR